jgi:hypothetical protein
VPAQKKSPQVQMIFKNDFSCADISSKRKMAKGFMDNQKEIKEMEISENRFEQEYAVTRLMGYAISGFGLILIFLKLLTPY